MKLTTWNINSVRLRIAQVERYLSEEQPDVLCLQEIKCVNDAFPAKAFTKLGYEHVAVHGQKGYHGVAIVSKIPFTEQHTRQYCDMEDTRHISVKLKSGIRVHNFYVPAGGDEPDIDKNPKFDHKMKFLAEMSEVFKDTPDKKSILVGDLNIAPTENDVWSHKQLLKVVSHTPIEVEALNKVITDGAWIDVARALIPEPAKLASWWSYRSKDWKASNRGRRLDHIWVTPGLKKAALSGGADAFKIYDDARSWEKPSDHAPVSLELQL